MILLLTACLLAEPSHCAEFRLAGDRKLPGDGPLVCLLTAQTQLADWRRSHPAYAVTGWRCVRAALIEVPA